MGNVMRVLPFELRLAEAAVAGDGALAEASGFEVAAGWNSFTGALHATRDALAAEPSGVTWGARLFLEGEPPTVVGWGGFKGAPVDGVVELGYEIAASHRGRGLATAAARAMLEEAFADDGVSAVIAHTLPEPNASNHILAKLGFHHDGETLDHGATVWRFTLARP